MKYVPGQGTKKSLGQHWLRDTDILNSIVDSAYVKSGDNILEIGPGLGTLTDILISRQADVRALEFDADLISSLREKYSKSDNVAIEFGDIRKFDFSSMPKNYKVVANIPYYLTSHLIRSLSETLNQPQITVLLIQKEVAERICAKPGAMGILSITAQFYFKCCLGKEVPAEYFDPMPKVDSQVVILKRRQSELFKVDEKNFFKFIKAGFSEKRKKLRNSLSGGLSLSKIDVETLLKKSGLAKSVRAQELSLNDWYILFTVYVQSLKI